MSGFEDATETVVLAVPDMDCSSCAKRVGSSLSGVDGIKSQEARPTTGSVKITYNTDRITRAEIIEHIEAVGYEVTNEDTGADASRFAAPGSVWRSRRGLLTWISSFTLIVGLLLAFVFTAQNQLVVTAVSIELTVADVLLLTSTVLAGAPILKSGAYSAHNLNLDIDLLMGSAIIGATAVGLYEEAATLAVLFSISELMEQYSMNRARNSLRELMNLSPDKATVRRGSTEETIPAKDVVVGDTVVVRPGERIPADGLITTGQSAVNQAPITGESVPVDKVVDNEVFAGTINRDGYLEVQATSSGSNTTIDNIIELVEDAQSKKTEQQQFVDRFARYYTPIVVGLALLTMAIPPLFFGLGWQTWFVRGLTLLVISCPCAFVISTPVSVVSAVTNAARNGVLIKGGRHLEAMGDIDVIATDKTGTLTTGELTVTDVVPLNGHSTEDVMRTAASLEAKSDHPIANAVVDETEAMGTTTEDVSNFESLTGQGVRGKINATTFYAGKASLFQTLSATTSHVHFSEQDVVATATQCKAGSCVDVGGELVPQLQRQGKTVFVVGSKDKVMGVIAIADNIRSESKRAVEQLQQQGVEVVMLTGDNERTAKAVAEQVGIGNYRADLLPQQKVSATEELKHEHGNVAMVGDGINDAPALATATVGVAMGAAGTDTAIETADIALMADSLSNLPYLYGLSNNANSVIQQNIWASLGVKFVLALGVPFGLVSVALAVLVGDMGMSIGVTGNALRLSSVDPGDFD